MIYKIYRTEADMEFGFYIVTSRPLSEDQYAQINWLIAETFDPKATGNNTRLSWSSVLEIGPRLSIETPFSSNAVSICRNIGITQVERIECTRRYPFEANGKGTLEVALSQLGFDRMTEETYPNGIVTFDSGITPKVVEVIDLIAQGRSALEKWNKKAGGGMDEDDIDRNYDLFVNVLKRNPTDVELFQIANGNSEHSRHWYFKGRMVIDGVVMPHTLFDLVQEPLNKIRNEESQRRLDRSLIAFKDNAGVIRGFETYIILPKDPGNPSEFSLVRKMVDITCTAETHNHPTAVAPFPGAETGSGGRIRDNSAVGRGGTTLVGIAGYCVGNLFIPGYEIPGEIVGKDMPSKYASPLTILIEASNGVSSYGNKYGEPVTSGFTRSFEQKVRGEFRAFRKPILYAAGVGQMFRESLKKGAPKIGDIIVRIGGPAYPVGVGGGSASSMMPGQNTEDLDYASVQRGNPEMGNRTNRVIRTCIKMGENNPISSIHDQGAGGPSNVLTELIEPLGGIMDIRKIVLGDKTMSVLTIWSAEFQEGYGLLIPADKIEIFRAICKRERVNCEELGIIDGNGKVVVKDSLNGQTPVDLSLHDILTHMPQKTYESTRQTEALKPLDLPKLTIKDALKATMKQLSVGSKEFLVHKADRSVGGLSAQQQCCGIAQIPIADVAVTAQSHFGLTGSASAIGERPSLMLIDPKAGARIAVGESLTNLASVRITDIRDIRYRANWMWPAKMPHEGAAMYDAVVATRDLLIALGSAIDGGKDSLSMVQQISGQLVKSPGTLVMTAYAPVPSITRKVTPDVKEAGNSMLMLIDIGQGKNRLGGSSLAQACGQLGNESPDVDNALLLKNSLLAVQQMLDEDVIHAMHDRGDGGLIITIAEMCMASRCGFQITLPSADNALAQLFSEELGFILEVDPEQHRRVKAICVQHNIPLSIVGYTGTWGMGTCSVMVKDTGQELFEANITDLREWWTSTSFEIEKLQMNPECAEEEYNAHQNVLPSPDHAPSYRLTFAPQTTPPEILNASNKPRVAILREEGTNGDLEMAAACVTAGLLPVDIAMSDLLAGKISLDEFQGIFFCGGFSYMDVFGSAKGWAATIRFNDTLREMFDRFYAREDTFSLGVCNGCQLMALLGWIPWKGIADERQPRFIHNTSGRFESRWAQVKILDSPSILLDGMTGSTLGIWVAHGEGRLVYPDPAVRQEVTAQKLAPLAFIDPWGEETESYPYNPNGSEDGITALCSPNGRHLAMMPHSERCFLLWQLPWMPRSWKKLEASPWLRMFQNARNWCVTHRKWSKVKAIDPS